MKKLLVCLLAGLSAILLVALMEVTPQPDGLRPTLWLL